MPPESPAAISVYPHPDEATPRDASTPFMLAVLPALFLSLLTPTPRGAVTETFQPRKWARARLSKSIEQLRPVLPALVKQAEPEQPTLWEVTKSQAWDLARSIGIDFAADEVVLAVTAPQIDAAGESAGKEDLAQADMYAWMLGLSLLFEIVGPACLLATLYLIGVDLAVGEALRSALDATPAAVAALPPAAAEALRSSFSLLSTSAHSLAIAGPVADLLTDASRLADPVTLANALAATAAAASGAFTSLGSVAGAVPPLGSVTGAVTSLGGLAGAITSLGSVAGAASGAVASLGHAAGAASNLRWLSFASDLDAAAFASRSLGDALGSCYLAAEAGFYLSCLSYAATISSSPQSYGFTRARRQMLWRRILADNSVPPAALARSWFYLEDGPSRQYGMGRSAGLLARHLSARALRSASLLRNPPTLTRMPRASPSRAASHLADEDRVAPLPTFTELTRGDVRGWLSRNLFYSELGALSPSEIAELDGYIDELEAAAGERLIASNETTPGLKSMCAATDPVRWRHRPLLYYGITQGLGENVWTPAVMAGAGYQRRTQEELVFWYRPPVAGSPPTAGSPPKAGSFTAAEGTAGGATEPPEALIFIHGVGVGPAPYAAWVDMAAPDRRSPVLAIELGGPAQRLFPPPPPTPERFARLVADALDALGIPRAVVAGHSLGSAYASYLAAADAKGDMAPRGFNTGAAAGAGRRGEPAQGGGKIPPSPRRIGGLVLIDPIACLLHQSRVTSQFVYTPTACLKEAADDFYFKKEIFTAATIGRHLPWQDAALWVDDRLRHTPTLVALSAEDSIVPAVNVQTVFGSWQARLRGVRVLSLPGIGHGGWLTDFRAGAELATAVRALRKESSGAAARAATAASAASAAASAASAATAYTTSAASGLGSAASGFGSAMGSGFGSAMGAAAGRLGSIRKREGGKLPPAETPTAAASPPPKALSLSVPLIKNACPLRADRAPAEPQAGAAQVGGPRRPLLPQPPQPTAAGAKGELRVSWRDAPAVADPEFRP